MLAEVLPLTASVLFGGLAADRLNRRLLMIFSDLARVGAFITIGVLALAGSIRIWELAALAAISGLASGVFYPTATAFFGDIVPTEEVSSATSLLSGAQRLMSNFAGPALGGFVVAAAGAGAAFLLDAATFVASSICLFAIPPVTGVIREEQKAKLRDAIRFVRSAPWLWATLVWAAATVATFIPLEILLPLILKQKLGEPASMVGIAYALTGAGGILGSLLVGHFGLPDQKVALMYAGFGLAGCADFVVALSGTLVPILIAICTSGLAIAASLVVWGTLLQERVPPHLRGRVRSIDYFVSYSLTPIALVLVGPASSRWGPEGVLLAGGVVGVVVTGACVLIPGVLRAERATLPQ